MIGEGDEKLVRNMLTRLGDDPDREGLRETPKRVVAAWRFWTSGTHQDPAAVLKCFKDGSENYDELVFQGGIPFYSHCEHHLAPFFGVAHLGYLPHASIVGLSKLTRLIEIFARRLSVQERITVQVADALAEHLGARGVGVVLQARHLCMESRGVQKAGIITTTSALRGMIKDHHDLRSEFMTLVSVASHKAYD